MKRTAAVVAVFTLLCACSSKTEPTSGAPMPPSTSAPATSAAATASLPSADEAKALATQVLGAWVAAQNQGNVAAYLAVYDAATFRGVTRTTSGAEQKLSFGEWKEQRTQMLGTSVTVAADSPKLVTWVENPGLGAGVVEIRFTQRWKNPKYADHGPKVLHVRVGGGVAKIVYEEMISTAKGWDDSGGSELDEDHCKGDGANSEVPCSLADGRWGWCKGGKCKDICPAGYSYDPLDTRCHQRRDCVVQPGDTVQAVKSARCNQCMGRHCFDPDATRDLL